MLWAVGLKRTWVQQHTDWSTDFTAQWWNRNLPTTYLYTELARVVTVRMLLSVVFFQQAPLCKMRAVFLKHTHRLSAVMIHGKASRWRNTAEGRLSLAVGWCPDCGGSQRRRTAWGRTVKVVRRMSRTDSLSNGKWWLNQPLHITTATLCAYLDTVLWLWTRHTTPQTRNLVVTRNLA